MSSLRPAAAFDTFAGSDRYSSWLGVPVRIVDRRFSATLEWGKQVRGLYEVVKPNRPHRHAMDFDGDTVPTPGRELVGYLRIHPTPGGSRVEAHQLAEGNMQASFLVQAWSMVLGHFAAAHAEGAAVPARRAQRPKRHAP